MIVCRKCGFKNADEDTFCGTCGTFLEWTGEKVERKVAPEIAEEVEQEAAQPRKGLLAKLQSVIYADVGDRDPVERPAKPGLGGAGGVGGPAGMPRPGAAPGGPPKPGGLGGGGGLPTPAGLPKPPGLGGPPAPPGLGGLPKPPGLGGLPKPPGLGGLPKPPGLGALPRPPGLGGLPKPPALDDEDDEGTARPSAALGTLPMPPAGPRRGLPDDEGPADRSPALGGLPKPPPMGGVPKPDAKKDDTDDLDDDLDDLDDLDDDLDDLDDDLDDEDEQPAKPDPAALVAPLSSAAATQATTPPLSRTAASAAPATSAEPEAMTPQALKKKAKVITKTAPSRRLEEGDLICGECGEGNPPVRKFCSRCGTSLGSAEVVRLSWWRRLLRPRRRNRVLEAGARPGRDGVKARQGFSFRPAFVAVRRIVSVVLILATLAYGFVPAFRQQVNQRATAARQAVIGWFTPTYDPIRPVAVSASSQQPDQPAGAVTDGAINTAWAAPDNAPDPAVVFTFDRPVDLVRAIVHNGQGIDFATEHRARVLHFVYSTGKTEDVTLRDAPDAQEVTLKQGADVTSVEMHVQQLHRAVRGTEVVISEIELFAER